MTINVEDFIKWLTDNEEMDLSYVQKAIIKNVVSDYANQYGQEVVREQINKDAYEEWLDKDFEWSGRGVNNPSVGISTRTFNALRRASEYDSATCKWISFFKTNRQLENASDVFILDKTRNISKNSIKEIREYLRIHRERFLGGANE